MSTNLQNIISGMARTAGVVSANLPNAFSEAAISDTLGGVTVRDIPLVLDTIEAIPSFNFAIEKVTLPTAPTWDVGDAPTLTTTFATPTLPEALQITYPDVPSFQPVILPTPVTPDEILFDGVAPDTNIDLPALSYEFTELGYTNEVVDAISAEITAGLYGVIDANEGIEWERGRAKLVRDANEKMLAAQAEFADRGFWLPPGGMFATFDKIQVEAQSKLADLNEALTSKRFERNIKMERVGAEAAIGIQALNRSAHSGRMDRKLEAEKQRVELAIATHKASVERYMTLVHNHRVAAQVFEARIQGVKLKLEAYKSYVESVRTSADIHKLNVQLYLSQLEGFKTYVDIYKTQVTASAIAIDIERLKLDAFKAKVEAYSSKLSSKEAEARLYEARIGGELSKVELYKAEVSVMKAKADAGLTKVSAEDTVINAQISSKKVDLEIKKVELEKRAAELAYAKSRIDSQLDKFRADVSLYASQVEANSSMAEGAALVAVSEAEIGLGQEQMRLEYAIAAQRVSLGRAKLVSAQAIALAALASAEYINDLKNNSARVVNDMRTASAERIAGAKNQNSLTITNIHNQATMDIASWEGNQQIRLSAIRAQSSAYIDQLRLAVANNVNTWAQAVHAAQMNAGNAEAYASLTIRALS